MSEPLRAQLELKPVRLQVDPLDQQLHDPGLLRGEQLLPQRVESVERASWRGMPAIVKPLVWGSAVAE